MASQKKVFLNSEGDRWYSRNKQSMNLDPSNSFDPVIQAIHELKITSERILEIGCSGGTRLNRLNKVFGSACFGIDPSGIAIENGKNEFLKISLAVGTADSLPFENNKFDLIIFGFCLYLCDRNDLFKIVSEADRCLVDKGFVVIKDFYPPFPYKNKYSHEEGIYSYKMDYSKMFSWNPEYSEIYNKVFTHSGINDINNPDERIAVTVLSKNVESAYPLEPFGRSSN